VTVDTELIDADFPALIEVAGPRRRAREQDAREAHVAAADEAHEEGPAPALGMVARPQLAAAVDGAKAGDGDVARVLRADEAGATDGVHAVHERIDRLVVLEIVAAPQHGAALEMQRDVVLQEDGAREVCRRSRHQDSAALLARARVDGGLDRRRVEGGAVSLRAVIGYAAGGPGQGGGDQQTQQTHRDDRRRSRPHAESLS
jgi:hypothetical protein